MDIIYIYSLFIRDEKNRYITRVQNDKVYIDVDNMINFFKYLAEYEECLVLDTYLINVENKNRIPKIFGDIFPHFYLIKYRELLEEKKRSLYNNFFSKKDRKKQDVAGFRQGLSDLINGLSENVTVSGRSFSTIFKKIEMYDGFENYCTQIEQNPEYLLESEPKFLYDIKIRDNKKESEIINLVKLAEKDLYTSGSAIDLHKIEKSRNKNLSNFAFDYSNMRDLLPHDQMPMTSNDIDMFMLEWRTGDWKRVLNSYSFELGYDSSSKKIKSIDYEAIRYQKQILRKSDQNMDKMVGNYLRTISWMVDYYMNADIEVEQNMISTWSYNYERSPMLIHISNFVEKYGKKVIKNMIKKVYQKSLVHTSEYIDPAIHKFYIYPQNSDVIYKIDPKYSKVFPDIQLEVKKVINQLESIRERNNKNNKKQNKTNTSDKYDFFDCRECPYFTKCIFNANLLTFKELNSIKIPDQTNNIISINTSNSQNIRVCNKKYQNKDVQNIGKNYNNYNKNNKYGNILSNRLKIF